MRFMSLSLFMSVICLAFLACGGGGSSASSSIKPTLTTNPVNQEVAVGASATFTVEATGTPAPTYQWQTLANGTTWVNVNTGTGATAASYHTPAASLDDDGEQFRVVATNSAGHVESNAATLHVKTSTITHGSQLDETNTGVPSGHTLTDVSSTIIVTESWISTVNGGSRVIHDLNFLSGASLIITVDGFTVQYCKFFGIGGMSNNANDGQSPLGANITIQDCEFDGNHENLQGDVAVGGSTLTLKRVHIHRWPRAMWISAGIWVEECYMHDLTVDASGAHIENIYVAGGADQTYIRNKLISNRISINGGTGGISASLAIYNEGYAAFPDLDGILVENNYLESDGGYAMYGGACVGKLPKPYAKNMTVRGNVFGRGIQRHCGVYGAATAFDRDNPSNSWENNTWGPRGPYWQSGDPEEGDAVEAPPPT